MIIAIDGPAASGKGTLGKRLAAHYGLPHLDTGLIYRALAKLMLDAGEKLDDIDAAAKLASKLDPATFDDPALKRQEIAAAASVVAALPQVRAAVLAFQRAFGRGARGAVLDGRDIGTVVFPDASVKIFVTATAEARARRRLGELAQAGDPASYEEVLAEIRRRDERDMSRTVAPLKPAADAHLLDTTHLDIDAAFRAAVKIVEAARAGRRCG